MELKVIDVECSAATNNAQMIEVTLEIGHHAAVRSIPTKEGYTHDWIVYVNVNNKQVVEKIQFNLHSTFKNPKRIVKSSPFQIIESGYGGFNLPIDVHFNINEQRQKVRFEYYLFLGETSRVSNSVVKKVAFTFHEKENKKAVKPKEKISAKKLVNENKPTSTTSPSSTSSLSSMLSSLQMSSSPSSCLPNSSTSTDNFSILTKSPDSGSTDNETTHCDEFIDYLNERPHLTSTPVKCMNITSQVQNIPFAKKQLRFSPSLEECRYFSDDDIINVHNNNRQSTRNKMLTLPSNSNRDLQENDEHVINNKSVGKYTMSDKRFNNNQNMCELWNLQKILASLTDRKVMKKIIRIIKQAGYLQIKESTYDFDLNLINESTIQFIRNCLS